MSTKAVREALAAMRSCILSGEAWSHQMEAARIAALAELEAIERAAKVLTRDRRDGLMDVRMAHELLESIAKDAP